MGVPTSLDTDCASVPQYYDTQRKSEQVWQEGTEAIVEVSQFDNNEQLANFNTLHGKPDLRLCEPSLPLPTTPDDNNKSEAKEEEDLTNHQNQSTVGRHQESPNSPQDPANLTLPKDLDLPIGCNRVQSDILASRQSIKQEKTVQEASIMQSVQIGWYDLPGGTITENSAGRLAKTWL